MRIEEDIFQRMSVDFNKLISYGFVKKKNGYSYSEIFMNGKFRADINISDNGAVYAKVLDIEVDEEYLPIHVTSRTGVYVGAVRSAYKEVLQKIAEACFIKRPFIYEQTNRITEMIELKYAEKPDHPFAKAPGYGVFRYPKNRKWYGVILNIKKSKLKNVKKSYTDKDTVIEIMNLKVNPSKLDYLLSLSGIYSGYHMNRNNWISVLLDGTVDDKLIMELIDESRDYAVNSKNSKNIRNGDEVTQWIIPANPKYFDIDAAFRKDSEIIWKQSSKIKVGDIVYIYVAAPTSAIRYKCEVIEANIPYKYKDKNISISHVMRIKLLRVFSPDLFTFTRLNKLGITAVRGPRIAPERFLLQIDKKL